MSNNYYTHRAYLERELLSFDFNKKIKCLEFGTGDGSGLIFNKIAAENKNIFIQSYETDSNWLNETASKYGLDNYKFNYINNWDQFLVEENFTDNYDLVFVDQTPWEARIKTIDLLINKAKIIILHDYDFYNKGIIDDIYDIGEDSFFSRYISKGRKMIGYSELLPPTLVISNL